MTITVKVPAGTNIFPHTAAGFVDACLWATGALGNLAHPRTSITVADKDIPHAGHVAENVRHVVDQQGGRDEAEQMAVEELGLGR